MDKKNHPVNDLLKDTIQKIKEMVDGNTVVGTAINMPNGAVVIPVSKVSLGFASGGSDIGNKSAKELFGGGGGAGVNVTPVAFLVCTKNGDIRVLSINSKGVNSVDKFLDVVPGVVDKVAEFIPNKNKNSETENTEK